MPLEPKSLVDPAKPGAAKPSPQGGPAAPAAESGDLPSRPEWLPEAHWDAETGGIKDTFGQHYGELADFHRTETERLAAFPEKIDAYDIAPDEAALAALAKQHGVEDAGLVVAPDDPRLQAAREIGFKHKLSPNVIRELANVQIAHDFATVKAVNDRVDQEREKLGPNRDTRIAGLATFLKAHSGKPEALINEFIAWTPRADFVEVLEGVMKKFSAQGATPITAKPTEPPPAPKPSLTERWYGPKQSATKG